ncbi:hypothetical protein CsSME_00021628 [Camellia sinensis var. sinensis]
MARKRAGVTPMEMVDNIGSTSHTQAGMNITSQSSTLASNFINFNIDVDPNATFYF